MTLPLLKPATITAIAISLLVVPFITHAAESTCVQGDDTKAYRLCMREEAKVMRSENRTAIKEVHNTARTSRTELRTQTKESRTQIQSDRKDAFAFCKNLRDDFTITDGMVPLTEVEAYIDCIKDVHTDAKESRTELKVKVKESRTAITTERKDARAALRDARRASRGNKVDDSMTDTSTDQ